MNCSSCGQPLSDETNFCQYCGTAIEKKTDNQEEHNEYVEADLVIETSSTWKTFIGKRADYYLHKWGFQNGVVTQETSWNWAACFFGIFWLGYRKMYRYILILLGSYLALDIFLLLLNVNEAFLYTMNRAIGIGISLTLGLFGNYLYYLHARRKIQQLSTAKQLNTQTLVKTGGTSFIGVIIAITLFITYLTCFTLIRSGLNSLRIDTIEFGYEQGKGEIANLSNEFSPNDLIFYAYDIPERAGTEFYIVIEKIESDNSFICDRWKEEVPREGGRIINSIFAPADEGQYVMKIIQDDKIVAEGTFFIVHSVYDGEDLDNI